MKDWYDVVLSCQRRGWRVQSYGLNAIIMICGRGDATRAIAILRDMTITRYAF